MSDTAETATPPTAEAAPTQETDWKAEARKWEARAKENAEAQARLSAIEEASKTEAQKQAEAFAALEAKVKGYETREQVAAWKAEIAASSGVPAAALMGGTKEEIEAHAEILKSLITQQPEAPARVALPIPGEGKTPPLALNGDGIEAAIKNALGI